MAQYCGLIGCSVGGSSKRKLSVSSDNQDVIPIKLKDSAVLVDVRGLAASLTAVLTYENATSQPLECQLVLPTNRDSLSIHRVEVDFNNRKVRSACRSRETAIDVYSTAFDASYNGTLLESPASQSDSIRMWLGTLKPACKVTVTVSAILTLKFRPEKDSISLILPSVFNPRYVPDFDSTLIRLDSNNTEELRRQLNFQPDSFYVAVTSQAYSIGFEAKIDLGIQTAVSSVVAQFESDDIEVKFNDGNIVMATLSGPFSADHDLELLITPADLSKPIVFLEPGLATRKDSTPKWLNNHLAAAWVFPKSTESDDSDSKNLSHHYNSTANSLVDRRALPKFRANSSGQDSFWIVVDRSETVKEASVPEISHAIILLVKSLPPNCKFNIISYGARFGCLFPKRLVAYSKRNVEIAIQFARTFQCDMGSADVVEPLKYIFRQYKKVQKARNKQVRTEFVFMLSSGETTTSTEVTALASKYSHSVLLYTVAVGIGTELTFFRELSLLSGGICHVAEDGSIPQTAVSLLQTALSPVAENVKVTWSISKQKVHRLIPERLSNRIYSGQPMVQFAVIENHQPVDGSFTISADIGCESTYFKQTLVGRSFFASFEDPMPMHRLAAKARLIELSNDAMCSGLLIENLRKEALGISIGTGIVCDFSALVAVETLTGSPLKYSSPIFAIPESKVTYYVDDDGVAYHFRLNRKSVAKPVRASRVNMITFTTLNCTKTPDMIENDSPSAADKDSINLLVISQKPNGTWKFSQILTRFCRESTNCRELRRACAEIVQTLKPSIAIKLTDSFLATAFALAILNHKFAERRKEYQLIEHKAMSFLLKYCQTCSSSSSTTRNESDTSAAGFTHADLTQFIDAAVVSFL